MGLFTKKSRETLGDTPKLSALAQQQDLDVLAPPPLPAATQRSVSGGSVSSLDEPKGFLMRGKLGKGKAPMNVFDGFDGDHMNEGYNDSVYEENFEGQNVQEEDNYGRNGGYQDVREVQGNATKPAVSHSNENSSNYTAPSNFVQHGTVPAYTPEFKGAAFNEFQSPNSNYSSPKPPPITIPKTRSSPLATPTGIGASPSVRSPLGSPSYMIPTNTYGESPKTAGMASAAAALAMGVSSFKTPPLSQPGKFESPQSFSTPSQTLDTSESTHPADHVNCSHGHVHHNHNPSPGHVTSTPTSPRVTSPPPPLAHPGYPKEHYIAKKKSSEALGEILPGRDLYAEAAQNPATDFPYPLSPSEMNTAPYPTCYYQKGCRQLGPHSHEEDVEPVFATFDQSKYEQMKNESRDKGEKIVWGQKKEDERAQVDSRGSEQSRETYTESRDPPSEYVPESRDSRFADPESRPSESAESRFHSAEFTEPDYSAENTYPAANQDFIPADLHRAESSIYPESVKQADLHRAESSIYPESVKQEYDESVYEQEPRDQEQGFPVDERESHDQSHDQSHDHSVPGPSSIDDFDFAQGGTHTPTSRLPLDSPGTPGTPDMSRDLSRDFNRLSVSHIKGMGLPLDTRSINSGEIGHSGDGHVSHSTSTNHVPHSEHDVNHGHVTHGQVVGAGHTSHMMLEPSQAEILRSSYISTDSGGGSSHVGGPVGSTGHVMDRHMMTNDQSVMEGHTMDEVPLDIDANGHVINHSPGRMHSPHGPNSRSGTMMTNMTNSPGAYYPAPIPMNLKLPPLLSKKNRRKSKSGISPFPSPRKSSFTSSLTLDKPGHRSSFIDKPGNRSSFMSPWSHTPDGSLLHYEGFTEDFERQGRSVHRMSVGSRGSSPLKQEYLGGDSRSVSRDVSRLSRDFDEVYGEYDGAENESAIDSSDQDPYYNPEKRGRRRTMSLTSINVNMDNSEVRDELEEGEIEGDVTDMQRYEASANAFTRVHIDSNAIVPPSAAAGYGNGIMPGPDQKPGTLVEELELRKKDKKAVRGHLNKTMHQYAADGTETPLIQQIHDSQSAYGIDDRRQSLISDKRMSMMTGMTGMTKDHSYEEPNHHRMSLLALDSLAQMDYQQSYSKPGAAQISKQYKASRDDDEPLRVRKQRLKRQSQQLLEQRQLQENLEKQRLASVELEKKRQEAKQARRNQFGVNAAAQGAQKKGKVLIGPGGEVIRT